MRTKIDMSGRYCAECGSTETYVHKTTGRPIWQKDVEGLNVCTRCARKLRRKEQKYAAIDFKLVRNL